MLKSAITTVCQFVYFFKVLVLTNCIDSDDIKNVDLTAVHNLTGPVAVEGAEPGDCLVVDILDGAYSI